MADMNICFRVLTYITRYRETYQVSPSRREIARAVFVSQATVQKCLDDLVAWGYVSIIPGVPRGIIPNTIPTSFHMNDHREEAAQ